MGGFRNDHIAEITGVPITGGVFTFRIRVTNFKGDFMERTYTFCVVAITPTTLPDAPFGGPYNQFLSATGCAAQNIEWTVVSGALPDGLQLELTSGLITGTPIVPGSFAFTVQARTGVEP